MTVVIVDWLGRGGIAQLSGTIATELAEVGADPVVVTRPGRELGVEVGERSVPVPVHRNRVRAHRAIVRRAIEELDRSEPGTLLVQNYLLPALERPLVERARRLGWRTVVVVHDGRLHSRLAGSSLGLAPVLGLADEVVVHSRYVARQVDVLTRSAVTARVVPLGLPTALLEVPQVAPTGLTDDRIANHFGVLKRLYKGGDLVADLGAALPDGWQLVAAGVGARRSDGVTALPGFMEAGHLAGLVAASACSLVPYRYATQSATVVLSQALGAVPIASAVGGIPEQIEHGRTGLLLPAGAPAAAWVDALCQLEEPGVHAAMVAAGREKVAADHRCFTTWARGLA